MFLPFSLEGEIKLRQLLHIALLLLPVGLAAQSAIERHVWQDARSFAPVSGTATAITGEITLSGNDRFAEPGSTMEMTFGNGANVRLTSEGAFWRPWKFGSSDKQTAEVFRLADDPGPLMQGNRLCGAGATGVPLYAVFFSDWSLGGLLTLHLAIFEGAEPPIDINSDGLCGTYAFDAEG